MKTFIVFIFTLIITFTIPIQTAHSHGHGFEDFESVVESNFNLDLKLIAATVTLLKTIPYKPVPVLILFVRINRVNYRITNMRFTTEKSTIGVIGPTIEILKWRGVYWPSTVIYRMNINQVIKEWERLK